MTSAVSLDIDNRLARLDTGAVVPVVSLFDKDGDETKIAKDAVTFVAGAGDTWASGAVLHVPGETLKATPTPAEAIAAGEASVSGGRAIIQMTIDDAEHFTPARRAAIFASYPAHERAARTQGVPTMGSGRVFPIADEDIVIKPIAIPREWRRIIGIDFGYDHPFGAVDLAHDADSDTIYVTKDFRSRQTTPVTHAAAIKAWDSGKWAPVAWPHDGLQHDKGSGSELAKQYRDQDLQLLPERATFEDGGNGVEAGVTDMLDRMLTGRWKVFNTCGAWLDEFRYYHRKDGLIVKLRDDVLSASRYALMMIRFAEVKPRGKDTLERANMGVY